MSLTPEQAALEKTVPMTNRQPNRPHALGKTKARPSQVKFSYRRYTTPVLLPKIPATFGHYDKLYNQKLGVLGNDVYGDCVPAGVAHIVMAWHAEQNKAVRFTMDAVLADYSNATGFRESNPLTDQGTDLSQYASYWRNTGVKDGDGHVHWLAAYLKLSVKDLSQIDEACYLFGAVGLGLQLPASAMDQFNNDQPWDIPERASENLGGHFVPLLGFDGTYYYVVSWGQVQKVTPAFLRVYLDEALAFLSEDMIQGGLSIDGFSFEQLSHDLAVLETGK